jgi:hypothetical protein
MRKGLFLSAMLASLFVTGAAMADRNGDNETNSSKFSRGQQIKEQVLDKQREVKTRAVREATNNLRNNKALDQKMARMRPHGDVYGDQASRSTTKSAASTGGKNLSATNSVNTPREIKQMIQRIAPMHGAYRVSQASEGTDSYGGRTFYGNSSRGANGAVKTKNMSATGSVNTPKEIQGMLGMFGGSKGSSAAGGGTDSYGGGSQPTDLNALKAGVYGSGFNRGQAAKYQKARETRLQERVTKIVKEAPQSRNLDRARAKTQ